MTEVSKDKLVDWVLDELKRGSSAEDMALREELRRLTRPGLRLLLKSIKESIDRGILIGATS